MASTQVLWSLLTLTLVIVLLPLCTSSAAPCINFGVNGHPITQSPYALPTYKQQLAFLNNLRVSYYRIDVPLEPDMSGRMRTPSPSQNLSLLYHLAAAASPPITLLPIIFPTDQPYSNLTYDALFNVSRLEGERWTRLYGHLFSVFELSNERDNVCIHNSDGRDPVKGYNQTCMTHLMAQMTGFAAGVKAVAPRLRIVIDYSWVHWGYIDQLVSHGMQWDILAPHWSAPSCLYRAPSPHCPCLTAHLPCVVCRYSNMGALNRSYEEIPDILQYIIDRYNKTLWITETNTVDGSMTLPAANQTAWILDTLRLMDSYPAVQAYMPYELLDEKQLGNSTGEAYYGMLAPAGGGQWTWKEVGTAYGRHVERYKTRVCSKCDWVSETSSELKCADGERVEQEMQTGDGVQEQLRVAVER